METGLSGLLDGRAGKLLARGAGQWRLIADMTEMTVHVGM
jgi:hypothetical protein